MKDLIITILGITLIISIAFNVYQSNKVEYTVELGESLIDRVEEDTEDYVLDVLCETDEYMEWVENKGE